MVFRTISLEGILEDINLNNPKFPKILREAEKEDEIYNYQDRRYSNYSFMYFRKFRDIRDIITRERLNEKDYHLMRMVSHFFIRKTLSCAYKTLSIHSQLQELNPEMVSTDVNIKIIAGKIEDCYIELEKTAHYKKLKEYCLEQGLKIIKKYPEEDNKEFIGRRAEYYLDFGQIEKDPEKKAGHFQQAYNDSIKQTEDPENELEEKDTSTDALYKKARICSFLSNYTTNKKMMEEVVEKGINTMCELEKRRSGISTFVFDNIFGFFYIKRARLQDNPKKEEDYEKGLEKVKNCLAKMDPDYYKKKPNDLTREIYGRASQAFSEAYKIKTKSEDDEEAKIDRLEDSDLENLINGIICSELSRDCDNDDTVNYQAIGRGYYDLQYLIEKANRRETGKITPQKIKEKIQKILEWGVSYEVNREPTKKMPFKNYKGDLLKIVEMLEMEHKLGQEMQFIAIESSFEAFKKSNEKGDNRPDNESYRGMCLVDLVKLNNWLHKFDREEARNKLNEAEGLLEDVFNKRREEVNSATIKEVEKSLEEKLVKDHTRLAECKFRLADITDDIQIKKGLYQNVINNNKKAKERLMNIGVTIKPEIPSFIASSHYKLAEISLEKDEKIKNLEETINFNEEARLLGDNSPENRSKMGSCYLRLLNIALEEKNVEGIDRSIRKVKETLEDAVRINESNKESFVYPIFLLGLLSQKIFENSMNPQDYGLKTFNEYVSEAIGSYNENSPYWSIEIIGQSKNFVFQSLDNHGLLKPIFLMKKGDLKYLEKEMENARILNEKLEKEFGRDRKFYSINPLSIISHEDKYDISKSGKYYVMFREKGILLSQMIQERDENLIDIVKDVVKFLGFIHAQMLVGESNFEYESFIKRKLNQMGIDENIIQKIVENYLPIREDLKKRFFVFNKDAHPRNWMIGKKESDTIEKIIALDLEQKRESVPAEADLASLLEFVDFNEEEKEELFNLYKNSLEVYLPEEKRSFLESFMPSFRGYLNASFPKAISVISWPTISKEDKIKILKNTRDNLNKVKKIDLEYYNTYFEYYRNILYGLNGIIEIIEKN